MRNDAVVGDATLNQIGDAEVGASAREVSSFMDETWRCCRRIFGFVIERLWPQMKLARWRADAAYVSRSEAKR